MVFGAPLLSTYSGEISQPTTTISAQLTNNEHLPNITLPESYKNTINYETLGGGIEGDMIFPKGFNPSKSTLKRGVAIMGPRRWPNNTIPYDLSGIASIADKNFILNAMQILMYTVGTPIQGNPSRQTCVYFRPRLANDQNFVKVQYGIGCAGSVGYWPGSEMTLTLANPGCFTSGIIQHELLHILGFFHEQSRPDRDSYITINYENIIPDAKFNFEKYDWRRHVLNQNSPYDYGSIMHYDAYAFSFNQQQPTIVPKRPGVSIGQREKLSEIDIAEVRALYSC